jgi:hypothetical protein
VSDERRAWTLAAAREMVGEVRARTEGAVRIVEKLSAERDRSPASSPERRSLEQRIEARVLRWAREMEALGVEIKGLWLVDFDTGSGCYCWRWPERKLLYYHGYDEGFAGRTPIQ